MILTCDLLCDTAVKIHNSILNRKIRRNTHCKQFALMLPAIATVKALQLYKYIWYNDVQVCIE